MKSPAYIVLALVVVVLFSLVAYRVSVHFAVLPGATAPTEAPAAPDIVAAEADTGQAGTPPAEPPASAEAHDAIARSERIRTAVEAFYRERGDWPQGLATLGLGVPGDHAGGPVAGITIAPRGVVSISLKPHIARGGVIRLTPRPQPDGTIDWQCRASNYPAATRLPDCR